MMSDLGNILALSVCATAIILVGWILWTMVFSPELRYRREARERHLAMNDAAVRCVHGVLRWKTCKKCAEEFGREGRPKSITVPSPAGIIAQHYSVPQQFQVYRSSDVVPVELDGFVRCGVCEVREPDSALIRVNNSKLRVCRKCFALHYTGPGIPKPTCYFCGSYVNLEWVQGANEGCGYHRCKGYPGNVCTDAQIADGA